MSKNVFNTNVRNIYFNPNNVTTDNINSGNEDFIAVFTNDAKKIKPSGVYIDPNTNEVLAPSFDTFTTTNNDNGTYKINNDKVLSKYADNLVVGDGLNFTATNTTNNTLIGDLIGNNISDNVNLNTIVGYRAGRDLISNASMNVLIGNDAGMNLENGNGNILIGFSAGSELQANDNNNIYIGTIGTVDDSNTIRIGNGNDHFRAFIDGVYGVNSQNTVLPKTLQISQDGQLAATDELFMYTEPKPVIFRSFPVYNSTTGDLVRNTNITSLDGNTIEIPGNVQFGEQPNSATKILVGNNQFFSAFDDQNLLSTNLILGRQPNVNKSFTNNTLIGNVVAQNLQNGDGNNTFLGSSVMTNLNALGLVSRNVALGYLAGNNLLNGVRNTYVSSEGPPTITTENDTTRIGLTAFTNRVFIPGIYQAIKESPLTPLPMFCCADNKIISKSASSPYLSQGVALATAFLAEGVVDTRPLAATGVYFTMDKASFLTLNFTYNDNNNMIDRSDIFAQGPTQGQIRYIGPVGIFINIQLEVGMYVSGPIMTTAINDQFYVSFSINGVAQLGFQYPLRFFADGAPLSKYTFNWLILLQPNDLITPIIKNATANNKSISINVISLQLQTINSFF